MSFKAELESLIANASSSLQDLESLLSRARSSPAQDEVDKGEAEADLHRQLDIVRQRISASLSGIKESYHHDLERLSELEGELKLDLENVRQCAIDYFIRGQYRESVGLLKFLKKVHPDDQDLNQFLELSHRKQLESEAGDSDAAEETPILKCQAVPEYDQEQKAEERTLIVQAMGTAAAVSSAVSFQEPGTEVDHKQSVPYSGEQDSTEVLVRSSPPALEEDFHSNEPRSLAELELKNTVSRDDEPRWPLSKSPKRGPLVRVSLAGLLAVLTAGLFWLSWPSGEAPELSKRTADPVDGGAVAPTADALGGIREEAQVLFDAGMLQAADRVCDGILLKSRGDEFALALKERIRATLSEEKPQTASVQSQEAEKVRLVSNPPVASTSGTNGGQPAETQRVLAEELPRQALRPAVPSVGEPLQSKRAPRNTETIGSRNPARDSLSASTQKEAPSTLRPQISPGSVLEVSSSIQDKEFNQARLLLEKLERTHPGAPEVKILGERLAAEARKHQSLALSWIEKAEIAQIDGRYVTPPEDNVLVYCSLALKADPGNQRAANLKREIVQRAVAQATDWIQRGKFDAARLYYASMDYLASKDDSFPYSKASLKKELNKLVFRSYPMVHDHRLGSCSGFLKFNAYAVSYVPSGGSGDGFTEGLSSIVINSEGERLRMSYRNRTFRFRRENGESVRNIYQDLIARLSSDRSTLSSRNQDPQKP